MIKLEAAEIKLSLVRLQMNDFFWVFLSHRGHFRDLTNLFKSFENLVFIFGSINAQSQQFFDLFLVDFILPLNEIQRLLLFQMSSC